MYHRPSWDESLATSLTGLIVVLAIVALLITIWLTIKAVNLVVRVMIKHPRNKPMWIALVFFLVLAGIDALTNGQSNVLSVLTGLSLLALLMTAKLVETYYDPLLHQEADREVFLHEVLHEPWWQAV